MRFILSCIFAVVPAILLGMVFSPNSAGNATGNFIQGITTTAVAWVVCSAAIFIIWQLSRSGEKDER